MNTKTATEAKQRDQLLGACKMFLKWESMDRDDTEIEDLTLLTVSEHIHSAVKCSEKAKTPTRPKIVCICGSSRFVQGCAVMAWKLNKQGVATFFMPTLPHWYEGVQEHHQAESEGVAEILDNLWLKLIEMADEVHVANVGGYIGERTGIEIKHAESLGKPVVYLEEK